jgi:hypothetical protein
MLVTLSAIKAYLGIPDSDTTFDAFLTQQATLFSSAIENYCGRKFANSSYNQKFYRDDISGEESTDQLFLYHFPIVSITSIKEVTEASPSNVEVLLTSGDYRAMINSGKIYRIQSGVKVPWAINICGSSWIEVIYNAGYATIPVEIQQVVFSLVEEAYNKKKLGVSTNFGGDIQRMSVPGVLSLDFDYTLQNNERVNRFGIFLGNYLNVLDFFRSERALIGEISENYVV